MQRFLYVSIFSVLFFCELSAVSFVPAEFDGEKLVFEDGARDARIFPAPVLEASNQYLPEENRPPILISKSEIPDDAIVDRAFLIWVGAGTPDTEVTLEYKPENGGDILSYSVTMPNPDENVLDTFSFQKKENNYGYTFRADVTGFFNNIYKQNLNGTSHSDYYGSYYLRNFSCPEGPSDIAGWAIMLIYTSAEVLPHVIQIYIPDFSTSKQQPIQLPDLIQYGTEIQLLRSKGDCKIYGMRSEVFIGSQFYEESYTLQSQYSHSVEGAAEGQMRGIDVELFTIDPESALYQEMLPHDEYINMMFNIYAEDILENVLMIKYERHFAFTDAPNGESTFCSMQPRGKFCAGEPFVVNWKVDVSANPENLYYSDFDLFSELPSGAQYYPGSTRYRVILDDTTLGLWQSIPDKADGVSALKTGIPAYGVGSLLESCPAVSLCVMEFSVMIQTDPDFAERTIDNTLMMQSRTNPESIVGCSTYIAARIPSCPERHTPEEVAEACEIELAAVDTETVNDNETIDGSSSGCSCALVLE